MKRKTKNIIHVILTLCLVGAFIYLEYDIRYRLSGTYAWEYALIAQPVFNMAFCLLWGVLVGLIFTPKEVFLRNIVLIPVLIATLVFSLLVIGQASITTDLASFASGILILTGVYTLISLVSSYAMSFLKWLILKLVALTKFLVLKSSAPKEQ